MIRYFTFSLLVMLAAATSSLAQEMFINASVNGYVPLGSTGKKTFPALHYDKDSEPGFIMGGFAIGGSYFKSHSDKVTFKAQANLVRYKYWDEPKELRAESNEPLGAGMFHSVNYSLALSGVAQYYLSERFSIGAGLGLHVTLASQMKARNEDIFGGEMEVPNTHYKRIMPVVPVGLY